MGSLVRNTRFKDKKDSLKTCLNCFRRSVRKRWVVTAAAIATHAHTASGIATVTTALPAPQQLVQQQQWWPPPARK